MRTQGTVGAEVLHKVLCRLKHVQPGREETSTRLVPGGRGGTRCTADLPNQSKSRVVEMKKRKNKMACQLDLGSQVKRETGL